MLECAAPRNPVTPLTDDLRSDKHIPTRDRLIFAMDVPEPERARALAEQLGLAPGTVARAYRELERQRVIVARGRLGTFVSDDPPDSAAGAERRAKLGAAARSYAAAVRRLGVADEEAVRVVRQALSEVAADRE